MIRVVLRVFAVISLFSFLSGCAVVKYTVDMINPSLFDEGGEGGGGELGKASLKKVAAISSASSASSGGGFSATDTRHEFTAGISHNFNNFITVEAGIDYSLESDYISNTPGITLKKELFEKNTTLTLGYSRNMDAVGGRYMDREEDRTTDNLFFGVTQLLSPVTLARIGYSRNNSRGVQTEGVRLVPVNGTIESSCIAESVTCVDEAFPGSRHRKAYILGVNHYFKEGLSGLLDSSSVKLSLRYYDDDWDITSYTGEVEYNKYLSEEYLLRFNYRYYTQTQAFFVKDSYLSSDVYKSSSPQLHELNSDLVGVKLVYLIRESAPFEIGDSGLQLNSIEGKYEYYTESIGVNANNFMIGVRLVF